MNGNIRQATSQGDQAVQLLHKVIQMSKRMSDQNLAALKKSTESISSQKTGKINILA